MTSKCHSQQKTCVLLIIWRWESKNTNREGKRRHLLVTWANWWRFIGDECLLMPMPQFILIREKALYFNIAFTEFYNIKEPAILHHRITWYCYKWYEDGTKYMWLLEVLCDLVYRVRAEQKRYYTTFFLRQFVKIFV